MDFGNKLKFLRRQFHITQKELAEILNVERATIAGYETRNSEPNFNKLIKLSEYFNVSIDYLLSNDKISKAEGLRIPILIQEGNLFQQSLDYLIVDKNKYKNKKLFSIAVKNDEFKPKIPKDSLLILEGDSNPKDGDLILARINKNREVLKYYYELNNIILTSTREKPIEVKKENIEILARVLEVRYQFK
ncbi:MAG: helix-turn-helix domain-containing protein [Peptoniphilaceae bacterium]